MEHGTWNMEHGTWNMVHGTWNMEHGHEHEHEHNIVNEPLMNAAVSGTENNKTSRDTGQASTSSWSHSRYVSNKSNSNTCTCDDPFALEVCRKHHSNKKSLRNRRNSTNNMKCRLKWKKYGNSMSEHNNVPQDVMDDDKEQEQQDFQSWVELGALPCKCGELYRRSCDSPPSSSLLVLTKQNNDITNPTAAIDVIQVIQV
jgi:hypothetical protein